jgi:hypothetical protein
MNAEQGYGGCNPPPPIFKDAPPCGRGDSLLDFKEKFPHTNLQFNKHDNLISKELQILARGFAQLSFYVGSAP